MSEAIPTPRRVKFSDYLELTKPRLSLMSVITAMLGYLAAVPYSYVDWQRTFFVVLGTALCAGGVAALNMWMESDTDAKMERTAHRPIVTGAIPSGSAFVLGWVLCVAGLAILFKLINGQSAFLALAQGKAWGERVPEREALLDIKSPIGHDYWELMQLAGRYAYAGREWVARKVVSLMGAREMELVHNHHNFAWKETHDGQELIVVRKGATTIPSMPSVSGFRTFRQVRWAGSFEGQTTLGLGVRARLPFRVLTTYDATTNRSKVIVDVAHTW